MLKVAITDELKTRLRDIDCIKAQIAAAPLLSESTLRHLEQEFVANHIHHAMRLHHYLKGRLLCHG